MAPFEPQANGQDVKEPVGPLHLSCPPFPQAQAGVHSILQAIPWRSYHGVLRAISRCPRY